jgi:protein OPY2
VGYTSLYARQNGCLQCSDVQVSCPDCASDEECLFTTQSCTACQTSYCQKTVSTNSNSNSGPNIGAIVGGVIGGLVVIGALTYLVWRFFIKNKRGEQEEEWQQAARAKEGLVAGDFASRRSERQSTHSVHSLASTVLTRASNIIQIAYIPGVTNRATPTSPTLLVPPVPPIPLAHSESGSPSPYEEQHFFVPGNLRDSQYSGISEFTTRTSYAPRSSVASTIYGKNAVVSQMPAQKGTLLKPSLVSVKSKCTGGTTTPPVPAVDFEKYADKPPASPSFSIGSTFLKNANATTATSARPQMVGMGTGLSLKTIDIKKKSPATSMAGESESSDSDSAKEPAAKSPLSQSHEEPPQSPFLDPPKSKNEANQSTSSLSAVIEEATRRAASSKRTSTATTVARGPSPFGDEHAMRE